MFTTVVLLRIQSEREKARDIEKERLLCNSIRLLLTLTSLSVWRQRKPRSTSTLKVSVEAGRADLLAASVVVVAPADRYNNSGQSDAFKYRPTATVSSMEIYTTSSVYSRTHVRPSVWRRRRGGQLHEKPPFELWQRNWQPPLCI